MAKHTFRLEYGINDPIDIEIEINGDPEDAETVTEAWKRFSVQFATDAFEKRRTDLLSVEYYGYE